MAEKQECNRECPIDQIADAVLEKFRAEVGKAVISGIVEAGTYGLKRLLFLAALVLGVVGVYLYQKLS